MQLSHRTGVLTCEQIRSSQSAPVRTDVDASAWVPPHLIPKPGTEYFDTFEYKYVMEKRQPIARFYASLKS